MGIYLADYVGRLESVDFVVEQFRWWEAGLSLGLEITGLG